MQIFSGFMFFGGRGLLGSPKSNFLARSFLVQTCSPNTDQYTPVHSPTYPLSPRFFSGFFATFDEVFATFDEEKILQFLYNFQLFFSHVLLDCAPSEYLIEKIGLIHRSGRFLPMFFV